MSHEREVSLEARENTRYSAEADPVDYTDPEAAFLSDRPPLRTLARIFRG